MAKFHDQIAKSFSKLPMDINQGAAALENGGDTIGMSDGAIMDLLGVEVQKTHGGLGNCIIDDAQKKV